MKKNMRVIGAATINQNGGITVPAEVRKAKDLNQRDKVVWLRDEAGYVFILSEREYTQMLESADHRELVTQNLKALGLGKTRYADVSEIKQKKEEKN